MTARFAFTVVAACLASACDVQVSDKGVSVDLVEGRASDEWVRTYDLPTGGRLEIVNADGPIAAVAAGGSQVEVRVSRQVTNRTDEAARQVLDRIEMIEEVSPDRVKVEAPDVRAFRGFGQNVRIAYHVAIPPGLEVSLKTQNGGVRIDQVNGRFTAATTNGSIAGQDVSGTIDASTVNGGINLTLRSLGGDARLVTVNGGIRLDVPADVNAELEATAVNGGVTVQDRLPLEATERARRRVSGVINAGGPRIEAQTTNGTIRIGVAGGP